jgi:hypothetical protein
MAGIYRFVVMEGPPVDYPAKFRAAIEKLGLDAEVETYPHLFARELTSARLKAIRAQLRPRSASERVFFCPGAIELYLDEPDMSFQFSAYRSWLDSRHTTVIPHPWTHVWPEGDRRTLTWTAKPPCSIGFMGTTYRSSRAAKLIAELPRPIRRQALYGRQLRDPDRLAWMNDIGVRLHLLAGFARFQTLDAVQKGAAAEKGCTVEIIDTGGFDGSTVRKQAFAEHLLKTTYVLCPRGHENYGWRTYEALRFGRVPVIVDTDVVLPSMVDWDRVALIVPGDAPEQVYPAIMEDYRRHSAEDFINRQTEAFAASDYIDGDQWLADVIRDSIANISQRSKAA